MINTRNIIELRSGDYSGVCQRALCIPNFPAPIIKALYIYTWWCACCESRVRRAGDGGSSEVNRTDREIELYRSPSHLLSLGKLRFERSCPYTQIQANVRFLSFYYPSKFNCFNCLLHPRICLVPTIRKNFEAPRCPRKHYNS